MSARAYRFVQVDVFTDRVFGGNPLAVVLDGRGLSDGEMQAISREMNLSETTFVLPPTRAECAAGVRIFTPADELPFAGHPTLGTAWVLRRFFGNGAAADSVSLRLGIGVIPVEFEDGDLGELVRMRPRSPELGATMDAGVMAAHLGLDASAVDSRHPCR